MSTVSGITASVEVQKLPSSVMREELGMIKKWCVEKYDAHGILYDTVRFEHNVLLNEGITNLWKVLIGDNTGVNYSTAYLGVGSSNTAASAAQTALQASTDIAYVAMDATYPQVASQTVTFRSTFNPGTGTFDWQEFTVSTTNSNSGVNLNRKTQNIGVKGANDTWVLTLALTLA